MNKNEKNKLKKYGKIVFDFANGKTTDDILTSFFNNLQSAFNFSSDFKQKALKLHPTREMIYDKLSSKEKDLFEMLLKRNNVFNAAYGDFGNEGYIVIEKYDPFNAKVTFRETVLVETHNGNDFCETESKEVLVPKEQMDEYFKKVIAPAHDKFKEKINAAIKLDTQIENYKKNMPKRFFEVQKIADHYRKLSIFYHYVNKTQEQLKTLLSQIRKSKNFSKSKESQSMLLTYNTANHKLLSVNNSGTALEEIHMFYEEFFLEGVKPSTDLKLLNLPIHYCLIEYLKNPEYCGKDRIAVCPMCECFFGKSKLNPKQLFCPVCSRKSKMTREERAKYMKSYRANPAQKRAAKRKKREEKIKHLMNNAGKTRKEAELIVDDDM